MTPAPPVFRAACIPPLRAAAMLVALLLPGCHPVRQAGHVVYATNESSGDLSVIDGATREVVRTVPLGKRPRGARLSPDGRLLYVALSGSPIAGPGVDASTLPPPDKSADGIGVVDLRTHTLLRVIRGVSDPEQLALAEGGRRLVIASEDTGTAVVADAGSGETLGALPVGGEPEGVTAHPDGRHVYVTSEEDHTVAVIDAMELRVLKRIPVGQRPRTITFSADGDRAWVPGENDASVTVIDAAAHEVIRTVKLDNPAWRPMDSALSADGSHLFVSTGRGGSVLVLDARTDALVKEIRVGERPWGLALSPDGRWLYTANGPSNDIGVVDVRALELVRVIPAGERPWGVVTAAR